MATLKKILFGQFAGEGLSSLVTEMQKRYTPKKVADSTMPTSPMKLVVPAWLMTISSLR